MASSCTIPRVVVVVVVFIAIIVVVKGEQLSFSSPKLNEEEEHSGFVPSNMKCDACTAVAYQINEALKKGERSKNGMIVGYF